MPDCGKNAQWDCRCHLRPEAWFKTRGLRLIPFPVEHSAFVEVLDRTVTPCKAIHNPTSAIQNGMTVWRGGVEGPGSSTPPPWSCVAANWHVRLNHALDCRLEIAAHRTSRLCGSAAHEQDEHRFLLGRAQPSQTLPPGGGWGNPVSPPPCFSGLCSPQSSMRLAPHTDGMKKGSSWEGCALPNPPRGRGLGARASGPRPLRYGETRFPHPPALAAYVHVRKRSSPHELAASL